MMEKREAYNSNEMELLFEKRTTYELIEIITFPLTLIKANSIIRSRLIYSTLTSNLSRHTLLIRKNSSLLRPTILRLVKVELSRGKQRNLFRKYVPSTRRDKDIPVFAWISNGSSPGIEALSGGGSTSW